jgi:16S rRNA (cytidine1402-2'-O)-methyltransferase
MKTNGKLFLVPTPLGENAAIPLPEYVLQTLGQLHYLVCERAKTSRQLLKTVPGERPIGSWNIEELNKRTADNELKALLQPALEGNDIGLLSEAGCPAVADPGARLVELAHQYSIQVVPLVGPSSILLALMASGLNGQRFCFQGYLPANRSELLGALKKSEQLSARHDQTQIYIETPYRNMAFIETALQALAPETRMCIAADLTLPTAWIYTTSIEQWKKTTLPDLHKRPAIFLLHAKK